MKINFKKLIINILIPVILGALVGFITMPNKNMPVNNSPLMPPSIIFPIVWTILYTLMGISAYRVLQSNSYDKDKSLLIYITQLIVNLLWSFFFFTFKLYLFAFIWLISLIILVILMIYNFYKIDKISAYIEIPYLLWILFAAVLNYSVFLLN